MKILKTRKYAQQEVENSRFITEDELREWSKKVDLDNTFLSVVSVDGTEEIPLSQYINKIEKQAKSTGERNE